MIVWRLRTLGGGGWLRQFYNTGMVDEAQEFGTLAEAVEMTGRLKPCWAIEHAEARPGGRFKYGEPT